MYELNGSADYKMGYREGWDDGYKMGKKWVLQQELLASLTAQWRETHSKSDLEKARRIAALGLRPTNV